MHLTWFSRSKTFSTCDGKLQQQVTSCEKNGHSQCMDNLSLPWWTLVCVFRRVWSDPCGTLLEASKKMNRKMARATKAIVGGVRPKRLGHEDGFSCIRGCHFGREVLAIDGFYFFSPFYQWVVGQAVPRGRECLGCVFLFLHVPELPL